MNCYSPPTIQPRCAPSDFVFFGALRGAFHGKRFGDEGIITEEVTSKYKIQTGTKKGIDAVVTGTRLLRLMEKM